MQPLLIFLAMLAFAVEPVAAEVLAGSVELSGGTGQKGAVTEVIVYFRPEAAVTPKPPAEPYVMATRRKRFEPRSLAIPVGASVNFPNNDPILHNAFSVSGDNAFDVGLYGEGKGKTVTFDEPGLVQVYCNVHQSMVGHVLVLDTPFFSRLENDGRFRLENLPAGEGRLYVWHEQAARPLVRSLTLPVEGELDLELSLTRRRVPTHLNKHGQTYGKDRRGRRRY